jgi:pyridoxine/pyridoxamine 5'-phosphate oxidase
MKHVAAAGFMLGHPDASCTSRWLPVAQPSNTADPRAMDAALIAHVAPYSRAGSPVCRTVLSSGSDSTGAA